MIRGTLVDSVELTGWKCWEAEDSQQNYRRSAGCSLLLALFLPFFDCSLDLGA